MTSSSDAHARAMLPIPDRPAPGLTTYDAKDPDTSYPPIEPLLPPPGAPNVLIVLLDDVGFGASSAFGGPCATRNAERLAGGGLKYNRFHTTALCAPTRQALLTGRNHHSVGMGSITETATSAPGNSSLRPNTKAPLAMTLKLNGYSTAQFGKCHEVPVWQSSPMGPFDAWPSGGGGFETFYGFIGGENNQWDPALYDGTTPVEPPASPEEGYHLTEDLADRACAWVRQQKALMPDRPFFMYFAPGATHAPHHVPKEWADRYTGQFSDGWDALRERTFARQKEMGVIPADAELTNRHTEIPAWDDMPTELKPVLEREMEVYAGFLEHTDFHVGRVIDAIEQIGVLDNTIIYYIVGDNGASAEGTLHGAFNEMANFNGMAALETPTLIHGNTQVFYPGMGRLSENSVVSIKNKSFSVTAEMDVPDAGVNGVIIAQGGRFGGWALYAKDGKAKFVYNVLGIREFAIEAETTIPPGRHQVRMEFAYEGGGLAKGGAVTLYYDGAPVGTGQVGATQPMIFSADETTDIGYESGTTVTPDYTTRDSRFTGKLQWVQIDLGDDDHDHFIDPEERFRIAMAKQ